MWKTVLVTLVIVPVLGAMFSIPYWPEWSAATEEERRAASEHRRRHRDLVSLGLAPILTVMFGALAMVTLVGQPDKPMDALFMAALSVCSAAWFVLVVRGRRRRRHANGGQENPVRPDRPVS